MFPSEEARDAYRDGLADARQGLLARTFSEDAPVAIETAYRRGWKNYRVALKQSQQLSPELNDDEIFVKSMRLLWGDTAKECKPAKGMRGIIMALNDHPCFACIYGTKMGTRSGMIAGSASNTSTMIFGTTIST